jgi:hypothetical protein
MSRQIKQLIEEMIVKKLNEEISDDFKGLTYKKTKVIEDDYDITFYDILDSSKKKVGEIKNTELTGLFSGHLYNKNFGFHTFEVKGGGNDPKKNVEAWFKTKSFQKWVANIEKYKNLKAPTNDYRLKSNKT